MRRVPACRCAAISSKSHPGPSRGSQRALRSIRKGRAVSGIDDSRTAGFRASPTLGRTGNFFGVSRSRMPDIAADVRLLRHGSGHDPECVPGPSRAGTSLHQPDCSAGAECKGGNLCPNRACRRRPCRVSPILGKRTNPKSGYSRLWRCEVMRAGCLFHVTARLAQAAGQTWGNAFGRRGRRASRNRKLRARGASAGEAMVASELNAFERILGALHEAALDPALWPCASALIDEALGTHGSSLMCGDGRRTKTSGSPSCGHACACNGAGTWNTCGSRPTFPLTKGCPPAAPPPSTD